jgi:hypothetical protein
MRINTDFRLPGRIVLLLCLAAVLSLAANSQTVTPNPDSTAAANEKSEQIIKRAIEVLGGATYLNVRTVVGRGFFTSYHEGISQLPARFLDYISYPDHERTEFTGGGIRTIQTNVGSTGWVFDGATKNISDQQGPQIEDFKRGLRTSVENLLRGWWQKEGGKVVYVGRREAGLAKRNETVRLTYPDGFWVEYEFGAKDGMPAKIIYKRSRKNSDSGDVEETTEEDRLEKPITIDGVTAPWVIDHFVNGTQITRINYESIQYNQTLADSLFAKPDNVKSIK